MKNKTCFVTEKEAARKERVNRPTKARFVRRSTGTVMIVASVGNTCGNTNTQYSNSNNRRDGKPVQADNFDHSYVTPGKNGLPILKLKLKSLFRTLVQSLEPKPRKASNAASKGLSDSWKEGRGMVWNCQWQ